MSQESTENNVPSTDPAGDDKVYVNKKELMAIIGERDHFKAICGDLTQDIATFLINGQALLGPFIGNGKKPNPLTLVSEIMAKSGKLEGYVIPIVALFEKYQPMLNALNQQLAAETSES